MGILQRDGTVRTVVIENRKEKTSRAQIDKHVEAGAALYSDDLRSDDGLANKYAHQVIDHAVKYVDGQVHTNGMENYWSLLKRGLAGTYVIILAIIRLLHDQGREAQSAVRDTDGPNDRQTIPTPPLVFKLDVPETAFKQFEAERQEHYELESKRLRTERQQLCTARWMLGVVILGTVGAFANLLFLKRSVDSGQTAANAAVRQAELGAAQNNAAAAQLMVEGVRLVDPLQLNSRVSKGELCVLSVECREASKRLVNWAAAFKT